MDFGESKIMILIPFICLSLYLKLKDSVSRIFDSSIILITNYYLKNNMSLRVE